MVLPTHPSSATVTGKARLKGPRRRTAGGCSLECVVRHRRIKAQDGLDTKEPDKKLDDVLLLIAVPAVKLDDGELGLDAALEGHAATPTLRHQAVTAAKALCVGDVAILLQSTVDGGHEPNGREQAEQSEQTEADPHYDVQERVMGGARGT